MIPPPAGCSDKGGQYGVSRCVRGGRQAAYTSFVIRRASRPQAGQRQVVRMIPPPVYQGGHCQHTANRLDQYLRMPLGFAIGEPTQVGG